MAPKCLKTDKNDAKYSPKSSKRLQNLFKRAKFQKSLNQSSQSSCILSHFPNLSQPSSKSSSNPFSKKFFDTNLHPSLFFKTQILQMKNPTSKSSKKEIISIQHESTRTLLHTSIKKPLEDSNGFLFSTEKLKIKVCIDSNILPLQSPWSQPLIRFLEKGILVATRKFLRQTFKNHVDFSFFFFLIYVFH